MQIALSTDSIAQNSQQSVLFDAVLLFQFLVLMSLSVALLLLLLTFQAVIF